MASCAQVQKHPECATLWGADQAQLVLAPHVQGHRVTMAATKAHKMALVPGLR